MNNHPDFLRSPQNVCRPDQRNEDFVVLSDTGFRPKQLEDQHGAVARLVLHNGVPEGIRIQFETTKNLYLYSWFVYRFYPVAQHHAYTCLELALRECFESAMLAAGEPKREHGPGLKRLLTYAIEKGLLKNENFEVWRHRTRVNAKMRTMYEEIEEMGRLGLDRMELDESKVEIKDVDRNHDYLTILLETIPYLRNHYAHGSKSLHNQVLGTVQIVAEIINQIFPKSESAKTSGADHSF